jgi:hypothetical protein
MLKAQPLAQLEHNPTHIEVRPIHVMQNAEAFMIYIYFKKKVPRVHKS